MANGQVPGGPCWAQSLDTPADPLVESDDHAPSLNATYSAGKLAPPLWQPLHCERQLPSPGRGGIAPRAPPRHPHL
ncbi:hypothetical protein [Motiliproteus sp. SC1-56]|uniref:hypothetical protein n=1 Tax=Motiliproteus sp. SC1-56 TaxID=2799565 RepID=UPI001A8C70FF|nr:hypothetical protein [Motiliproteus sp. SC1-56]